MIDDGSGDGTAAEAVHAGARVITLPFNLGIGSAVQTGYMAAQEGDFDVAIQVDGDGQHPASEITRLVKRWPRAAPISRSALASSASALSRAARPAPRHRPLRARRLRVCGVRVTDTTSGFRAGNRRAIALFAAAYPHDYPEVEAVIIAHRAGLRIVEVPVEMRVRQGGRSSITPVRSAYYMVKVLMAVAMQMLRRPVKLPDVP